MVAGILWGSVVAKTNRTCSGWLFQGFEEGIEGLGRQHVDFVDDVDFVPALGRAVAHGFAQFPNVVDAAVGSTVDFEDIDGIARG